jgi:hypothetical protein
MGARETVSKRCGVCDILISAAILFALVEWLGDDAIDFTGACILAFAGFIVSLVGTFGLAASIGAASFLVGSLLAGIAVSFALFIKYGVQFGRAFAIGGLYVAGSLGWKFGLSALVRSLI